ncbi:hypothetical protein [Larkinella arboricola]
MQRVVRLRYIGLYQIIGGIVGLLMVGYALMTGEGLLKNSAITVLSGSLLFTYSIVCGWFILIHHHQSLKLSIINQGFQVLMIGFGSFLFKYCSGIYLTLGFDVLNDKIESGIGLSIFHVFVNSGEHGEVSVNIIAAFLLVLCNRE